MIPNYGPTTATKLSREGIIAIAYISVKAENSPSEYIPDIHDINDVVYPGS
jgi:hypothetical protein